MLKLSIIIPAYNEEDTVVDVLNAIAAHPVDGVAYEVIVVDDGSTDGTRAKIEAHPRLYSHLVCLSKNGGKGAAVKAGLAQAGGDYILFQDADFEYDPADYVKLLGPVIRFQADLVMGSRMSAPPITRVYYFWNKIANKALTWLFNLRFNVAFTDIFSCYLLYRRSLLNPDELVTMGWEQHAEIMTLVVPRAKRMYEVPVSYYGRSYEEGKKIRAHHVFPMIWTILFRGPGKPRSQGPGKA
ncbi:MAG TPA: glycosyltransferase family 2 protein [Alphaproteobacteria bacterium]